MLELTEKRCRELHLYKELMTNEERRDRYKLLRMAGANRSWAAVIRDWSPRNFQLMLTYYDNLTQPKLKLEELEPETQELLGLKRKTVGGKLIVLGRVLQDLNGLSSRDALWVLRATAKHIINYRDKG